MAGKSLAEWLEWQETLNPAEIDLGLDRIHELVSRLNIQPPPGRVFTIAGSNGKGSCAAVIAGVLRNGGFNVGVYSSPHLVRYNERITVNGAPASDAELVAAFERIEGVRGELPLTYFEFGTLAAWLVFLAQDCDAWVLEIGLGGRLDAVNAIDADYGVITTIGLEHQDWLGDSIEAIAAEKAGIMRTDRPVFYGDTPVPASIRHHADDVDARLSCLGEGFSYASEESDWSWQGETVRLDDLRTPFPATPAQFRNISVALAALEAFDSVLLGDTNLKAELADMVRLPGRFQRYRDADAHEWVLDVAHNPQAAAVLRAGLAQLDERPTTIVLGLMADKNAADFIAAIDGVAAHWIMCSPDSPRALPAEALADVVRPLADAELSVADEPEAAMAMARSVTPRDGRIVVCGSFMIVGPAIDWLGLY